ncbi:MAG: 16S rRNA (adenine(1518)-N(6)/adenine(1519)-N(6))-dimethyltransferase RsmA [Clostridia bacterium]|nr:16S rRNA (adenine(1518)-N(6)/adenine(1519)-N(6))-dimethyltransferase RsmA [Clostridia bacterium]
MDSKILSENNFRFNKQFGQNFIFDKNLLTAIVKDSQITKQDDVLEIGPGAGTLTKIIAEHAKKVVSYEIDKNLEPILEQNLSDVQNSKIIFADALKTDITEIEQNFDGEYKIVANLPYYITTPLIFKFVEQTKRVQSISIMVQKEVAERLVAKKSTADYGTISIILDFYGDVKVLRNVPRRMFIPAPNVDSAVVQINIIKNKYTANEQLFKKLVHCAFAMRRKTLVNNLSQGFGVSKEKAKTWLDAAGFGETIRGEQLSTADYVNLTNIIEKNS